MWPEGEEPRRYDWQVGHHDRAAQPVVPPALQHRHHAGALSRVQARSRLDPQCAGRAQGLDQQAARRRPDRLRRRKPLVRTLFAEALGKHGLQPRMDEAYQAELAELPPKAA